MIAPIFKEEREIFLTAAPLPVGEILNLHYYAPASEEVNLVLMDAWGKVLYHDQKQCKAGMSIIKIGTRNFSVGRYKISVISQTSSQSRSFELR